MFALVPKMPGRAWAKVAPEQSPANVLLVLRRSRRKLGRRATSPSGYRGYDCKPDAAVAGRTTDGFRAVGSVGFVGVIFAILLQLNHELWKTQREMMRLPSEPVGAEYSGFMANSHRGAASLPIQSAGPTPFISPNSQIKHADADGEDLAIAQIPSGEILPAVPIRSHWP
jgi:hypothetical protein